MKKLALSVILVFVMYGCALAPIKNQGQPSTIKSIHTIATTFEMVTGSTSTPRKVTSTSFHIGGGYIVTCAHCVEFNSYRIRTPFGYVTQELVCIKYVHKRDGHQILLMGTVDDIALLHDPLLIGTPAITWGDSDLLKVEDRLLLIGNSGMDGINYKKGIVSRTSIKEAILDFPERTAEASFIMTTPTNPGDSGGPVFLDDTRKLVGMCYAGHGGRQGYNLAIKSNYIQMAIKEIMENR